MLTPGTAENTSFEEKLDCAAAELMALQDAGDAVLWAPFHEYQPNGWFWWSKGTPEQYASPFTITRSEVPGLTDPDLY